MEHDTDPGLTVPVAFLLPLAAGGFLVGVRGVVAPEVVAVLLAFVVVLGGLIGGRAGGAAAALMATATFDFFHTQPYQSLKIARATDLWIALALLAVGLVVGDLSGRISHERARRRRRSSVGTAAVSRVLAVAEQHRAEDVELSVRAELLDMLALQDCWFTAEPFELPLMDGDGECNVPFTYLRPGGFELPTEGFAIPVAWHHRTFGCLACRPVPHVGISVERRRVGVAMAEILALALVAEPATA